MHREQTGTDVAGEFSGRLEDLGQAWRLRAPELAPLLDEVIAGFRAQRDAPETRKTHLFGGRYENIYIARERIPALAPILDTATAAAATIVSATAPLRAGFWFNEMQPGYETTLHTHDDDDELLSGVFYLTVPEGSGDLLLGRPGEQRAIPPLVSSFVFFSPQLPHAVGKNRSDALRLSIGMNFGIDREA